MFERSEKRRDSVDSAIKFYNAAGALVGEVARAKMRRFSMQAASDHRKMDGFKILHPEVVEARLVIGSSELRFEFVDFGRSRVQS